MAWMWRSRGRRSPVARARGAFAAFAFAAWALGGAAACPGSEESEGPASRGYCAKRCVVAADCCSASATGCPGAYPQNFACVEGLCRAPRCETNADCTFGATPACRTLGGLPSCVVDCSANADCVASGLAAGACTGQADDGAAICGLGSALCQSDADCLVPGMHCLDGVRCGCRDDADCASAAFPHCRAGTCSCAADAECGPGLDVCTTDRAFAYPPSAAPGP